MAPYSTIDSGATRSVGAEETPVGTEFLIVGAGPAGAALACFLGSHGMFYCINMAVATEY